MTAHPIVVLLLVMAALGAFAAFCLWTSRINQYFFFGRTAPSSFATDAAAKEITRRYAQLIVIGTGCSFAGFAALRIVAGVPLAASFLLMCILEAILFHIAFARAHRETGAALQGWANATEGRDSATNERVISVPLLEPKATATSRVSTMLLAIVAACLVWGAVMATTHMSFGALAEAVGANGGSELTGFGVGVLCAGTLFSLLVRYSARYRTPMAQCTLRTMFVLEWVGVLALAASALAITMHVTITRAMTREVIFPALGLAVVYAIYSRSRLSRFAPPPVERNGDQFWRWGLFYNNSADPALFIQARTGPGYTLNFGKMMAWPIAAAVCGYLVLLVVLGFHRF